jgi:serine/threonine-protein kinase
MEYLDGHTLRNEIDTNGFLPIDRACEIADKVLLALDYAHKNGVIHRDIKPDNIQLLADGRIKLTDFGIARLTFEPNLTMDGQVFGTPSYMSPEQVVGKDIDARSDLFSMGAVIFEMVSGQKPFQGDSVVAITFAIMNKEPDKPTQVHYAFWQFLQKALEKAVHLRFHDAEEMRQALLSAQKAAQQPAPSQGLPVVPPPHVPNPNPYLQQQPVYNYYHQQQTPLPPPIAAPYNPYQVQPAYVQTPYQPQPSGVPLPNNIPIYYPPPPRAPLLKPETKVFLGRLFLTLAVVGTLVALIIVGIDALSKAASRAELQGRDEYTVMQIAQVDSKLPIEDQIAKRQQLIATLKDRVTIAEQNRQLAVLYQKLAAKSDFIQAESALKKSIELDPNNADYYSNLGNLYANEALRRQNDDDKLNCLINGAQNWQMAADRADDKKKDSYDKGAAAAAYNCGYTAYLKGERYVAINMFNLAKRYGANYPEVREQAEKWLKELGR